MKKIVFVITMILTLTLALSVPMTSYAAQPQKYSSWSKAVAKKIRESVANKKLTIDGKQFTAFTPEIRDAMLERPDVRVAVQWKQNGEKMKFTIPAGTDVAQVFDKDGYAGFAYLQEFFGENGDTEQAKALLTQSKAAANAAKIPALKDYAGNNEDFNAYSYYIKYQDLQEAIGPDGDKLLEHYNNFGKAEGRTGK